MRPPTPVPFRVKLYLSHPAVLLPLLAAAAAPGLYQLSRPEPVYEPQPAPLRHTPAAIPFDLMRASYRSALPKPAVNQKRAGECVEGVEVELNGGCWMATDKTPPCPAPKGGWVFYAHEGKCWVPVAHTPRPATSAQP
jgi:hypothetical protein